MGMNGHYHTMERRDRQSLLDDLRITPSTTTTSTTTATITTTKATAGKGGGGRNVGDEYGASESGQMTTHQTHMRDQRVYIDTFGTTITTTTTTITCVNRVGLYCILVGYKYL